jgi:hypothetical protein
MRDLAIIGASHVVRDQAGLRLGRTRYNGCTKYKGCTRYKGVYQIIETERVYTERLIGIPGTARFDVTLGIDVAGTDPKPLAQDADVLPGRPNLYDVTGR